MVKIVIAWSVRRWYLIVFCAFVLWFFRSFLEQFDITNKKLIELEAEVQYLRKGNILGDTSNTLNIMNDELIELGNLVRHLQETANLHPVLNELQMTEKKVVELEMQVQYLRGVHNSWISAISLVPDHIGLWNEKTILQAPGEIFQRSQTPETLFKGSAEDIINDTMIKIGRTLQMIEHFSTVAQDALTTCTKDKDGHRDFAFIQTGGSVIASLTSKSISFNSSFPDPLKARRSWRTLFDSLISGRPSVTLPDIVLIGDGSIGACWAFSGSQGQIGIALSNPINISGVTVEHIGKELAQDSINVAPKDFELWGLVEGKDRHAEFFLFSGFYDTSKPSISQTFEFTPTKKVYEKVIFKINSNHGNQHYTCVYRVRIHGIM